MSKKKKLSIVQRSALISVSVFIFSISLFFLPLINRLDFLLYDYLIRLSAPFSKPSEEISLVLLDQESIDWAFEEKGWKWPWPREAYGDIVHYFNLANAASLSFDVLFTEPSLYGDADDAYFAKACAEYGKVVQTVFFQTIDSPPLFPIESIKNSAFILGDVTGSSDIDKVARRAKAFSTYGNESFPSLGLAPLKAAGKDISSFEDKNPKGRLLRFQSDIFRYVPYSASDILKSYYAILSGENPILELEQFTDSYIFFGFYAPGLFDITATPIATAYPGVGVHVTQLDNFLQNSFINEIPFWLFAVLLFLSSFISSLPILIHEITSLKPSLSKYSSQLTAISFIFIFLALLISNFLFFILHIYIPLASFLISLFLGFITSIIISYYQEGKQRRYIKDAFKQYLSPVFIEELIANPDKLKLGGERKALSIFFSDVQGFTSISEKLSPTDLTSLLNDYLSEMTEIILASGGTIDKYEGDAIIAFWNAPLDVENHAQRAVEAAVACQEKLSLMRNDLEKRAGQVFKMRIGINTGEAVVGNMGSHSRFDYSMLGDSVNLAARLEGFNKQFGTYTMCSLSTKEEAEKFGTKICFRELGKAGVVGKSQAVRVFEPMTSDQYDEKKEMIRIFETALEYFYSGDFEKALSLFQSIHETDSAVKNYAEKILGYIKNPPKMEGWDGTWIATTK